MDLGDETDGEGFDDVDGEGDLVDDFDLQWASMALQAMLAAFDWDC